MAREKCQVVGCSEPDRNGQACIYVINVI